MPRKIFISYRREDSAANALGIGQYLEHEFGRKDVFIDVDMRAGAKFPTVLEERLSECKVMLVLIGPGWLNALDEQGRRRLDAKERHVRFRIAPDSSRPENPAIRQVNRDLLRPGAGHHVVVCQDKISRTALDADQHAGSRLFDNAPFAGRARRRLRKSGGFHGNYRGRHFLGDDFEALARLRAFNRRRGGISLSGCLGGSRGGPHEAVDPFKGEWHRRFTGLIDFAGGSQVGAPLDLSDQPFTLSFTCLSLASG